MSDQNLWQTPSRADSSDQQSAAELAERLARGVSNSPRLETRAKLSKDMDLRSISTVAERGAKGKMIGFCQDPLVTELKKRGYCLVPLPDSSIMPGLVVGRKGKLLFRLGDLAASFHSGHPAPNIQTEDTVAPIDITETGKLDGALGARVLTSLLGSDPAGLEASLSKTKRFVLKISNIKRHYLELRELDLFLSDSSLEASLPTFQKLMATESIYVVSAVLQTSGILLEAQEKDRISSGVSAKEIHSESDFSVKLSLDSEDQRKIQIKSSRPVTFAFQATKIFFADGLYKYMDPDLGRLQMLGPETRETRDYRLVEELSEGVPIATFSTG